MTNAVREKAQAVYKTFRRLTPGEREGVVELLIQDPSFREDLLDIATIEHRRYEQGRPLQEYLSARPRK